MSEVYNKEVEYLKNKVSEISYNQERFKIYCGENKILLGVISSEGKQAPLSTLNQYKTIYDTLQDLDWKIKISLEKSIEYTYSKPVQENYSLIHINSKEESLAYYYIENALFRTSSLWDMLAQLYRLFYQIKIRTDKVFYKQIFKPDLPYSEKFKSKAEKINDYIHQEDNTSIDGEWEGNHNYTNDCRNKMTHRNSPNITAMSDYDFNFKSHPSFMLKRIIEDYAVVSNYLKEILDEIEGEVIKDFD